MKRKFKMPKLLKFRRKKLRATAVRRPLRIGATAADYGDVAEPSMKLSRALLIVLLLHVVAVAGIIAFNAIKTRQASLPSPPTPTTIGIVMLFSTSAFAKDSHGDPYFFLKHQSLWFGVGLAVCIAAALIDYHFWQRTWWIWLGVATITLVFCFIPHIGMRINGSRRWIGFGPIGFQPSEIAKLAAVFFLAWWFARYEKAASHPLFGFAIPLAIIT